MVPAMSCGETMQKLPITVLITTLNEELNLPKALASVIEYFDQVCVIDSESKDKTLQIAAEYGAEVHTLLYEPGKIIPWIFQWALDNIPFRNDWVLILEADREVTSELVEELYALFAAGDPPCDGYYIRRKMIFRGKRIRFGGYGSKYLLTLFRRGVSQLDPQEEDTRVYVNGKVGKLKHPVVEYNLKEAEILFYLQKHLRYAQAFAVDEFNRRQQDISWKAKPSLLGTRDQRVLWLKTRYYRSPLYLRSAVYFSYRYFIRLGFLDGKQGAFFHFLQAFWFRLIVDIRLEELLNNTQSEKE
jgi:glycosyltransferase involved in cell wall biosynthesis